VLQTSHLHCCVQLLLLSLHTKNNQNHYSTSRVITIFVCSVHYFLSSFAA